MTSPSISVVIPTFGREAVLVETAMAVQRMLEPGDELVVVDQTGSHDETTERAIRSLPERSAVRWYRKARPSICEAMNAGALLASGELLVFLDDDVQPAPDLLDVYRQEFAGADSDLVLNGQILQPWNPTPVSEVRGFGLDFDFAFDRAVEITALATGNAALRRRLYLAAGGMDETFAGGAHRCDADLGFRIRQRTGRHARFEPRARVRHLRSAGGTRAHGDKDSWASISSAIGDHYFGMRWFGPTGAARHSLARLARAPINRRTARRPWLVASLAAREFVAIFRAARLQRSPPRLLRSLEEYDVRPW